MPDALRQAKDERSRLAAVVLVSCLWLAGRRKHQGPLKCSWHGVPKEASLNVYCQRGAASSTRSSPGYVPLVDGWLVSTPRVVKCFQLSKLRELYSPSQYPLLLFPFSLFLPSSHPPPSVLRSVCLPNDPVWKPYFDNPRAFAHFSRKPPRESCDPSAPPLTRALVAVPSLSSSTMLEDAPS